MMKVKPPFLNTHPAQRTVVASSLPAKIGCFVLSCLLWLQQQAEHKDPCPHGADSLVVQVDNK